MLDVYKVICINHGVKVNSVNFKSYDLAVDFAIKQNEDKGYVCLILFLDNETFKWKRRLVLYPKECC